MSFKSQVRKLFMLVACILLVACGGGSDNVMLSTSESAFPDCSRTDLTVDEQWLCNEAESEAQVKSPQAQQPEGEGNLPQVEASVEKVKLTFSSQKAQTSCAGNAVGPAGEIYGDAHVFPDETLITLSIEVKDLPQNMYSVFVENTGHRRPFMVGNITVDGDGCQGFAVGLGIQRGGIMEMPTTLTASVISFLGEKVGEVSLEVSGDLMPDLERQREGVDIHSAQGDSGIEFAPGTLTVSVDESDDGQLQCVILESFDYFNYKESWSEVVRVQIDGGEGFFHLAEAGIYRAGLSEGLCDTAPRYHSPEVGVVFRVLPQRQ